ncbi:MAG: hypothetical protein NUV82_00410 [Candidatus Komeilibacteria bacterium]|nr:hypothetical protein [Candidatus Komeilibacteria bacterium]
MLETSKDLLFIVIAFCILWFTIFLCWFIYYMVTIIKRVSETVELLSKMAHTINEFVSEARVKMASATSYLPLVVNGVRDIASYIMDNKTKKKTAAKTKNKK